ncbi:single-stranded DNA-binding protein [Iamia majanohamensis]|uniref:Single-stranded DNA-binding protein n=1 Tax=Iamia majanohamensis TaxID=467976 RepID=A0AAE9YE26_9ACTN|nr:single-stranded DNA-binding protein [Iamia majanohamensis]WCO69119.1 single-stranded DNA-binding protein [Iamia majanohamensis]
MNVVLLRGTLSRPPTARDLPSGDQLVALEVTTRPPEGRAESVPVAWVGAPARVLRYQAGDEVVVTGRIRRRFFRAGGATASRTEVVADAVWPAGQRARSARAVARALEGVDAPAPSA